MLVADVPMQLLRPNCWEDLWFYLNISIITSSFEAVHEIKKESQDNFTGIGILQKMLCITLLCAI